MNKLGNIEHPTFNASQKFQWNMGGAQVGGVRPSPGAATSAQPDVLKFFTAASTLYLAAPGDGRTPLLSMLDVPAFAIGGLS
jgi:hypothetical protein